MKFKKNDEQEKQREAGYGLSIGPSNDDDDLLGSLQAAGEVAEGTWPLTSFLLSLHLFFF